MGSIEDMLNDMQSSEDFGKISESIKAVARTNNDDKMLQRTTQNFIQTLSRAKISQNTLTALQLMADQRKFDQLHELAVIFMERPTHKNHLRASSKVRSENFSIDIDMW